MDNKDIEKYKVIIKDSYENIIHKDKLKITNFNYENSSVNIIPNFININQVSFDKLNTVCIVFKVVRDFSIINYSYLYCNSLDNHLEYKYITFGSSLMSKYGEFRKILIQITNLNILQKYTKLISFFERIILKKLIIN